MPRSAPRPCAHRGCRGLVRGDHRYCDVHQDEELEARRRGDERRGTAAQRGYDSRWRRARARFLKRHPICRDPLARHTGRVVAATVVDHIVPHRGDEALFWDERNWQPLCRECHDAKTARGR